MSTLQTPLRGLVRGLVRGVVQTDVGSTVPTDGRTLSLNFASQLYHGCAVGGTLAARTLSQLVTGATGTAAPGASGCLIGASDDVSVPLSPVVFGSGSWWQASAGTFYVHSVIAYVNATFPRIFEMTDGSDDNRLIARYNETTSVAGVVTVSTTDAELTNTPYSLTAKLCIAYDATGFSTVLNGGAAATNAAVVPTLTACQLGNRGTTKNRQLDGYLREFRFYPTKKTEAAMQALTA